MNRAGATARTLRVFGARLALAICAASAASRDAHAATGTVAVVVNKDLKPLIQTSLDGYVADLTNEGYTVEVRSWDIAAADQNEARELRGYLNTVTGIVGSVFIGTVPIINYYNPSDFSGGATFPFDLYFMDLDVTWQDSNSDGVIDGPSTSGIHPEIWVSRIKCGGMTVFPGQSEAALVQRYLEKIHRFRRGELRLPDRALLWADTDWNTTTPTSYVCGMGYAHTNCLRITDLVPGISTDLVDWQGRWQHGYESEYFMCHSSESLHQPSANTYSADIAAADIRRLFWNCWNCSSARYNYADYIAGVRLFTPRYGLVAIGTTKTGSMLYGPLFYQELNAGKSHGDAFKAWFASYYTDVSWHRGMTLLGDGTLRLGRFTAPPNPTNVIPVISAVPPVAAQEDIASPPVAFSVGDGDLAADDLIVWGESNNRNVLPSANLTFGGSGSNRTLSVLSTANASGSATVTVYVCDGQAMATSTCLVSFAAVNDAPAVTVTDPNDDHDVFMEGRPIPMTATATDIDGNSTVSNVDFFFDGARVAQNRYDGNTTYTGATALASVGTHTIFARAYDAAAASADSLILTVRVVSALSGGWTNLDVGTPKYAGAAGRDGALTVVAGGGNADGTNDHFHFLCRATWGNGEVRARLLSIENTDPNARAGVMVRSALDRASPHAFARLRQSSTRAGFQYRQSWAADDVTNAETTVTLPCWLRLVKQGAVLSGYRSTDATNWIALGTVTNPVPDPFYVGAAVAAGDDTDLCTAEFDQLSSTFAASCDADADALPDWWETAYFGGTNAPEGCATNDADHDGLNNAAEWAAGTNPTNQDSVLAVAPLYLPPGGTGVVVRWASVTNRVYALDRATNLTSGFGAPLRTNLPATAPTNSYADTNAVGPGPYFYRIRVNAP